MVYVFIAGESIEIKVRDIELSNYKYGRRTNYERELEMAKVKALLEQNLNGREIAKKTGIPYSTCGKYIQKVTNREKAKLEEIQGDVRE